MPKKKSKASSTPIDALKHKDKRANIPTEELRDFVADDEKKPKTILYPRDSSLDPQLVWKGKDEQDRRPLEVPAVPIYIQEKIHPRAIIEEVRAESKKENPDPQPSLFSDFNGIKFEELIDFYSHKDGVNWSNRMILGDSLLVMTSLAEKEGLKGKVQMIYLDPPYGIKFGSNWQVSTRKRDVKDGKAEDATRQPEQIKAFRDTWQLGIHSYLAYLRDRLVVARELLTETGSVFVQIGDENVHLVRCLLDEVFGSENSCGLFTVRKTSARSSELVAAVSDYLVWYAKDRNHVKYRALQQPREVDADIITQYGFVEEKENSKWRSLTSAESENPKLIPINAKLFRPVLLTSSHEYSLGKTPFIYEGKEYGPGTRYWSTSPSGLKRLAAARRLFPTGNTLNFIRYLDDFPFLPITNMWTDTATGGGSDRFYVVQTTIKVIERCLLMTTDPGDLVLDPTCGSGTTAYVAEQWGRRWITCDTSRVALALARTRLMAAKFPYYLLADSPEGVKKEMEVGAQHAVPLQLPKTDGDIKKGFVYKRVPHVTLKSIANNPDIKEGMTREEIDAAIAKHAETETLYDQPYEDHKRIRVTGPFTVESLSPHRVLSVADDDPVGPVGAQHAVPLPAPLHAPLPARIESSDFVHLILDNLKKAGVQNTVKDERLKFDRLEPYAGEWIQAIGEYTDKDGAVKRAAVSIGPEHGTVGPEQVKEAAKEALKGAGFDLLVVCGFAFDARAGETAKEFSPVGAQRAVPLHERSNEFTAEAKQRYGKLPALLARINPDLAMGDELLKKTGAGNLFMVFGEPDVEIKKQKDGKIAVEIKGVDVYDPTTGQIRNSATDDIACWFIDTDYNKESFFVRHAYFTGADAPYEKLKRALRVEIDEAAWSSLYATKSRPFDPPLKGKIAVKVINHYGDEVMKVFKV